MEFSDATVAKHPLLRQWFLQCLSHSSTFWKEVTEVIYRLRSQMALEELWVNSPASPVALHSYIWQAELQRGFCPRFPSVRQMSKPKLWPRVPYQ